MPFGVTNGVSTFQRIIDNLIKKYKLKKTYAYLDNVTVTGRDKDEHNQNLKAPRCCKLRRVHVKRKKIYLLCYRIRLARL